MRLIAAIALGVFTVGIVMTWATDWAIAGADGDIIGALLMIGAGWVLVALILLTATESVTERTEAQETEAIDEPDDRLSAGRPRG